MAAEDAPPLAAALASGTKRDDCAHPSAKERLSKVCKSPDVFSIPTNKHNSNKYVIPV